MTNAGSIYSVVYRIRPVYRVMSIPVQVRNTQVQGPDGAGSPNVQARFPVVVQVRAEVSTYTGNDGQVMPSEPPRD